jgi:hypothetical protein
MTTMWRVRSRGGDSQAAVFRALALLDAPDEDVEVELQFLASSGSSR